MIGSQLPAAAPRQHAAKQPLPSQSDGAPSEGKDAFAALLTQLAQQLHTDSSVAALVRPEIGSDAKAFAASPLLVRTALASATNAASTGPASASAVTVSPAAVPPELLTALTQALEAMLDGLTSHSGDHAMPPAAGSAASKGQASPVPALSLSGAATSAPLSPAARASLPGAAPIEPAGTATSTLAALPQGTGQTSKQSGSWALHCLPVEGGFRLLVRLIRLPDDLRGELEARLRDLFSEFGLNLRDLDLRETGSGGA